jgi:hypothetical protein
MRQQQGMKDKESTPGALSCANRATPGGTIMQPFR